jgi:rRNA maturation endonuclease Nob1
MEWTREILGPMDPKDWLANCPMHSCPECGAEALVRQQDFDMDPPEPGWVCFNCGATWDSKDLDFCDTCGSPYERSEDDCGMCNDCMDEQMGKD